MTKNVRELFDLTGKTAIVTGGSRGIGKEMAEGLAEAGASLMLCARRPEWLDETVAQFQGDGYDVTGKTCDVSKPEQVQAVVDEAVQKFGKVDILVNKMLKLNSGSIINIASISGITSSANGPFYAGYVASKAGLIGLTRELAASWGRRGIRVNAIAPGFFHSRLADSIIDIYERSIQENNVIPRIGNEGELKGITVFLASDASSYITGQTIAVDGGMTV